LFTLPWKTALLILCTIKQQMQIHRPPWFYVIQYLVHMYWIRRLFYVTKTMLTEFSLLRG